MSDIIKNAIDSLNVGDANKFREGIISVLAQKISDRLDVEKNIIAGSIYGETAIDSSDEIGNTETNDEDV